MAVLSVFAPSASAQDAPYPQSPSNAVAVPIPPGQIDAAVAQLDGIATDLMQRTGVPGMAIAVVHNDAVVYAKGFGVRELGQGAPVDEHTVFQLASVSKPIGGTIISRLVGEGVVAWDDPVSEYMPNLVLSNRNTTRKVTIADMFAHRSGLPDHIGDILEDLGVSRREILRRLRFAPLTPLRQDYAYSNYGLSAAAYAVARKAGMSWASLAEVILYEPLEMTSTSSRYSEFEQRSNRATLHTQIADGSWVVGGDRDPDRQMPAGGVSSTVSDLAQWMRLQLANGVYNGQQLVAGSALQQMHTPLIALGPPATPDSRPSMSALGIDTSVDATGRVRFNHSGAFTTGASTVVNLLPSEGLGIVVLTNGWPVGLPEAVANDFLDLVGQGHVTRDWLTAITPLVLGTRQNPSRLFGRTPPSDPREARRPSFYAGTYQNDFYGEARVVARGGRLTIALGPEPRRFTLAHWSANTYSFDWVGENEYGIGAVDFERGRHRQAGSMVVEVLDEAGLGTFTRR